MRWLLRKQWHCVGCPQHSHNCDHLGSLSDGVANWPLLNWNDISSLLILASALGHTMGDAGMLGGNGYSAGCFRAFLIP